MLASSQQSDRQTYGKRKSLHLLRTREVNDLPESQRVPRSYSGTSPYRRHFFDIWVKLTPDASDDEAVQTSVIQCKACMLLMLNEGGHIKNHCTVTCPKRAKAPSVNVGYADEAASPSSADGGEVAEKPPNAFATVPVAEVRPQPEESPALSQPRTPVKNENEDPVVAPVLPAFGMQGASFEQLQLLCLMQELRPPAANLFQPQPVNFPAAVAAPAKRKRRLEKADEPAAKKSKDKPKDNRRRMRQTMLHTKDLDKISKDRFVFKEYSGPSEYRKNFLDVYVKAKAEDADDTAIETAVIICKHCDRTMSNEGGHIKSHVQSACKGSPSVSPAARVPAVPKPIVPPPNVAAPVYDPVYNLLAQMIQQQQQQQQLLQQQPLLANPAATMKALIMYQALSNPSILASMSVPNTNHFK